MFGFDIKLRGANRMAQLLRKKKLKSEASVWTDFPQRMWPEHNQVIKYSAPEAEGSI